MRTKNYKPVTHPKVNQKYHLTWALPTTVFTLKSWDNSGNAILESPKKKRITSHLNHLRNVQS